jgi:hypothetical protein
MNQDYDSIPVLSKDIIARKDTNGMLLFQVKSDEMYFISFNAYKSFLRNCDGSQTLWEVIGRSGMDIHDAEVEKSLEKFVDALCAKNIIELW